MGIFDSLFGGLSGTQKAKTTVPKEPSKPKNTFSFCSGVLSEKDSKYSSATWDDNTVFFNYPASGLQPIGYYEPAPDSSNKILVLDVSDKGEIGFIDLSYKDGLIFLSRSAIYHRFQKMGGAKQPMPPIELFAEISHSNTCGSIYDEKSNQLLADYTGDKLGAAAAFICLSSELHEDSKYSKFLTEWDKY